MAVKTLSRSLIAAVMLAALAACTAQGVDAPVVLGQVVHGQSNRHRGPPLAE